jgi:hypothetical protein
VEWEEHSAPRTPWLPGHAAVWQALSTWYVAADSGCGKGSTYRQIHSCTAGQAILKQAFKVGDEPVSSPIVVGGKIVVMSSTGPVVSAIAVRFTIRWR